MKPKVVILGAGLAGLSVGWLLKQKGIDFVILEKQKFVGGLARSFEWHGFYCDFAAHRLFTSNEYVLHQLLNLVPMGRHVRRSKIYLQDKWMRDPLDTAELAWSLSLPDKLRILIKYLFRPKHLPEINFENYVRSRYGEFLYRIFFQPYTEKLFGISGSEISVLWARQKVRLANPLDHLRENTKTKFQYFYYPIRRGYGAISENMYAAISEHVITEAQITQLIFEDDRLTRVGYIKDGQNFEVLVDHVVSTLPMTITAKMLGQELPLNYQKVDAVYMHINRKLVSDYHWIYFMDSDIAINRLVEFKNMSPVDVPVETTVLCAEVTQEHTDVVQRTIDDLVRVGLISREDILDTKVIRENFAYPVYSQNYDKIVQDAESIFSTYRNLHLVGRAAQFRHFEADDNLEAATRVAEEIAAEYKLPISIPSEPVVTIGELKMSNPAVTVVVLTYNHYEDTQECLKSVFSVDYDNFSVVLVDNGSTDGTPDLVAKEFPQVHIIPLDQNLGVPAGYNVGFQYALNKGADYVLMLNNDTILAEDLISQLVTAGEADAQSGILMPLVLYHGTNDTVWSSGGKYRKFPPSFVLTEKHQTSYDETRLIEYAPSCGLLIHRRAFEAAGLFDPGYFYWYDDWDFSERVRAHGLHIWNIPQAKMWHKVSRTIGINRSPLFWHTYGASMVRYYRRHGRPVWLSLPLDASYLILREMFWKGNWRNLPDFWKGMLDGFHQPLGGFPKYSQ